MTIYHQLCSFSNLLKAFRKASRGKRGRPSVAGFEYALEENLLLLQQELRTNSYRAGGYRSFYIHDPKRRLISAAPFRDRVVHHALCNIIEPVFERSFVRDSYANRLGKGTHRALDRAQYYARRCRYVLQCDVKQFFPSIDHVILRGIIAQKIDDTRVLSLIDHIIESGEGVLDDVYEMVCFPGDELSSAYRARGLPIGNLTSQFWANVYLNPFDHFVKRELGCKGYVRYVDDMLLFTDDKETLWRWRDEMVMRLQMLRLSIHRGAHPRPVTEGIPFLGFVVYSDRRRLKRRKAVNFQRKFKRLALRYKNGEIDLDEVGTSVRGWVNHVRYGNTVGLRKSIFRLQSF